MKVLFIGGTGTISMAITNELAKREDVELYLLNRGNRNNNLPSNIKTITVDINNEAEVIKKLNSLTFDSVCDFIGFVPEQIERDYRIFKDITKQYIYISSASAYEKPCSNYVITEETKLENPYWEYSRNKIVCEELLMKLYKENNFPITIVRPSHTYDERSVPLGVQGDKGSYQVIKRMLEGKPVIIHGDGTSLWTMTHNKDFAKGFIGLIANPETIGETYQITSDESLTWNQIYEYIAKALNVELHPYYVSSKFLADAGNYDFIGALIGDKSNTVVFDNSKLKKAVPSFKPTISFEEGVKEVVNNVLSDPLLQIEDLEFDKWCDKVIDTLENAKKVIKSA